MNWKIKLFMFTQWMFVVSIFWFTSGLLIISLTYWWVLITVPIAGLCAIGYWYDLIKKKNIDIEG